MKSDDIKKLYGFIDKARVEIPKMKNPVVILIYEEAVIEEDSMGNIFAYTDPNSFMQAIGNFLIHNPNFIRANKDAITGAEVFLKQQKGQNISDNLSEDANFEDLENGG